MANVSFRGRLLRLCLGRLGLYIRGNFHVRRAVPPVDGCIAVANLLVRLPEQETKVYKQTILMALACLIFLSACSQGATNQGTTVDHSKMDHSKGAMK